MAHDRIGSMVADAVAARDDLLGVLDSLPPDRLAQPGLVGSWSAKELIAHLGYWTGHAVEVLHAAEGGSLGVLARTRSTDEINETVARVARESDLQTVQRRESGSFEVLVERLRRFDSALLGLELPDGGTVEGAVREDAPEHYREHAEELRAVAG